ncbi:MAG TPA: hypothetical protein VLB47_15370, partial [Solirubrobacteraceae bacterium]|nr:hypothetical protein [Solirubrobacteraceae bacterium]
MGTHRAPAAPVPGPSPDRDSRAWLAALRSDGPRHDDAVARLWGLLRAAARFEVRRRAAAAPHLRGDELEDIAM